MDDGLYEWQARFLKEGMTYGLRLELFELLKPYVQIRLPFQISERGETGELATSGAPNRIQDVVNWDIVLGASDPHEVIGTLKDNSQWLGALPDILSNLASLLLDALDLMRELEGATERSDNSYWHQPSIADHPQNQKFRAWTALIDLTRDAFLATAQVDPGRARAEVERWKTFSYPLFRRLSFFAATETDLFPPDVSLRWLLAEESWWMWSVETEREALRLLSKLAETLNVEEESALFSEILRGPPKEMFSADIDDTKLRHIKKREIWLRLSKYQESSLRGLSGDAAATLESISEEFPNWRLAPDQSDEFPVWMGEIKDLDKVRSSPKALPALKEWLLIEDEDITNDDWSDRCKDDFQIAISALMELGRSGRWPSLRWRTALQVWSDPSLVSRSWDTLRTFLYAADDDIIQTLARPMAWWLEAVGKVFIEGEPEFLDLARRLLATQVQEHFDGGTDPIFKAINHPVGQTADAVFRWWYRQGLKDGQGLGDEPKGIFSTLNNLNVESFRYGRIILAANIISLFRVDRNWTERYLLRNFDWRVDVEEAQAAWTGFLWAPRLYLPLLLKIKRQLFETAENYDALGQFSEQYASLLTFIALENTEEFTKRELAIVTSRLPPDGLSRCATTLVQSLDGAGDKRAEHWRNRIRPYLKEIWPKSVDAISRSVANSFARLCMKAGDAFPDAVSQLKPWLSSATQRDVTLYEFSETHLAARFPEAALIFLNTVLAQDSYLLVDNLKKALDEIREVAPSLEHDPRFERLMRYVRQFGN
jgi:hypothetical protein